MKNYALFCVVGLACLFVMSGAELDKIAFGQGAKGTSSPTVLNAGTNTLVIDGVERGAKYLLTVGSDGAVTIEKATVVTVGGGPSTPTPPAPQDLAQKVKGWADAVNDPRGAAILSAVYYTVGKQVEDGQLTGATEIQTALKRGSDTALVFAEDAKAWAPVRQKIGVALSESTNIAETLKQIASGLEMSADPDSMSGLATIYEEAAQNAMDGNRNMGHVMADAYKLIAEAEEINTEFLKLIIELVLRIITEIINNRGN